MTDQIEKEPKQPIGPLRRAVQVVHGACTAPEKWAYRRRLVRPDPQRLPDFLGIGAQKAGSSWLWENLRCHPDLFLPDQKELHFFDRRYHRSLRAYMAKFNGAAGRVKGEITPAYSTLAPDRIRLIHSLMPELRVLLLLRDPVERAWSHALMHLLDKQQIRSYEEVRPEEFYAHFSGADSRGKGAYLRILENWTSVFPADQVFVGFFEDIQSRPEALLKEVLAHLGVSTNVDAIEFPFRKIVNRGRGAVMPPEYRRRLVHLYREELAQLRDRFGDRVATWGAEG